MKKKITKKMKARSATTRSRSRTSIKIANRRRVARENAARAKQYIEAEAVTDRVSVAGRGVEVIRAELDQHKQREAKQYVEISKILEEMRRDVDSIDSRCQRLEANAGRRAIEEVDRKSPAEEAGEFETATGDAAVQPRGWRHVVRSWRAPGSGEDFDSWAVARLEELYEAMKERISWERDANNEIRDYGSSVAQLGSRIAQLEDIYNAQKALVPPEGCELVVRRTG